MRDGFKIGAGLHQGAAQRPFLIAVVFYRLTDELRQASPWSMVFADNIVICSESMEQVNESL